MHQVQRWGNSLGIRIPKALAIQAGIEEGAMIEFEIEDGKLIIKRKQKELDDMLAQITPDNLHKEVSIGDAVGREAW